MYSLSFPLSSALFLLVLPTFPTRRSSDLFRSARDGQGTSPGPSCLPREGPFEHSVRLPPSALPPARHCRSYRVFERTLPGDRKSTRLNSSHVAISYAVFFLQKKKLYN